MKQRLHARRNKTTPATASPQPALEVSPAPVPMLLPPAPLPAEVAFEHIGYFTPASKRLKGISTKEKIVAERLNPDGTQTILKVQIIATGKYGLPTTSDL